MNENLKSLEKLKKDIKSMKLLYPTLSSDLRHKLSLLETELAQMETQVDLFIEYYSNYGWCVYDSISSSLLKNAITAFQDGGIDAGEKVLLTYYENDVKDIVCWLKDRSDILSMRYTLITQAFDDHFAKRYYASVPLFLIIIDGAVNDFTRSKGFFAEGTDVTAWDCLVGCSESLEKLKGIFNKGRNKTNADEIFMPYRNGILHGRDINYGNEYVSCKCVALLFAIADWINMKSSEDDRKAKYEKEMTPPSFTEIILKLQKNKQDRMEIEKWKARQIQVGVDVPATGNPECYLDYPYLKAVVEMFAAWKDKNFGQLALHLKSLFKYEQSEKKRAGECRKMFFDKDLMGFSILEVEERACSLSRILTEATWKCHDKIYKEPLEFGCAYQSKDGRGAFPWAGNGTWTLIPWKVQGLYKF